MRIIDIKIMWIKEKKWKERKKKDKENTGKERKEITQKAVTTANIGMWIKIILDTKWSLTTQSIKFSNLHHNR